MKSRSLGWVFFPSFSVALLLVLHLCGGGRRPSVRPASYRVTQSIRLLYIKAPFTFDLCQSLAAADLQCPAAAPTASGPAASCQGGRGASNTSHGDRWARYRGDTTCPTPISGLGWGTPLWTRVLVIGGRFARFIEKKKKKVDSYLFISDTKLSSLS